jgi:transcription elongation factor GreB
MSDNSFPSPDFAILIEGTVYMTPQGYSVLQKELQRLRFKERPEVTKTVAWAAGNGDRSENGDYIYGKKKLREIDKRLEFLCKRLDAAVVLDPKQYLTHETDKIYFGATVEIRFEDERQRTYTIVGVDEVDVDLGKVSWRSPIGRALLKASLGDVIEYTSPKGIQEIEILSVTYEREDEKRGLA